MHGCCEYRCAENMNLFLTEVEATTGQLRATATARAWSRLHQNSRIPCSGHLHARWYILCTCCTKMTYNVIICLFKLPLVATWHGNSSALPGTFSNDNRTSAENNVGLLPEILTRSGLLASRKETCWIAFLQYSCVCPTNNVEYPVNLGALRLAHQNLYRRSFKSCQACRS